jgi:hypothetical protein
LRSVEAKPTSLVEKVRNMAIKREQQAANALSNSLAKDLKASANSYRALAEALAKEPDNLRGKLDGSDRSGIADSVEGKIG